MVPGQSISPKKCSRRARGLSLRLLAVSSPLFTMIVPTTCLISPCGRLAPSPVVFEALTKEYRVHELKRRVLSREPTRDAIELRPAHAVLVRKFIAFDRLQGT